MEKDLEWQVGSKSPPKVCLCCGMPFGKDRKINGPYYTGPYIWVCDQCWGDPNLFFPDKVPAGSDKSIRTESNQAELMQLIKPTLLRKSSGISETTKPSIGQVIQHKISITPDRTIDAELREISLSQLKLDRNNVRFKHFQRTLTEEEMTSILWREPDLNMQELYNEIIYSHGLTEPPVVDANYVVREGNRRVACLRKIVEEIRSGKLDVPLQKIDPVQCVVLSSNTIESDVAVYLARVHVSGKKEWRVLNQAAHIYDLHNVYKFDFEDIRKAISKSKFEVITMEKAYKITLEYHTKFRDDESWLSRYSYFYELCKNKVLKEWSAKTNNLKLFMKWVHDGKVIEKGTDVRLLAKIIESKDKDAYKVLLKEKKVQHAYRMVTGQEPGEKNSPFKIINKTYAITKKLSRDELRAISKDENKLRILKRFHRELSTLIKDIEAIKG